MKIGVVSNAVYCLPLLQTLAANGIQASVFSDAGNHNAVNYEAVVHFCNQARFQVHTGGVDMLYFWLEETKPDVVFVMGYAHLIDVKQLPLGIRNHIYNVHFGPLPAYRGPSPVFWQIKNGEEKVAATIHRINEKFDAGAVVWSKEINREAYMTFGVVNMILPQVIIEGVVYIIQQTYQKKQLPELSQNQKTAQYYKRPQLADVLINWNTMSAKQIVDLILACNPWNRGAVVPFANREVKVIDADITGHLSGQVSHLQPGTIISINHAVQIMCRDGLALDITMLNIDGNFVPGRHVAAFDFKQGQVMGD